MTQFHDPNASHVPNPARSAATPAHASSSSSPGQFEPPRGQFEYGAPTVVPGYASTRPRETRPAGILLYVGVALAALAPALTGFLGQIISSVILASGNYDTIAGSLSGTHFAMAVLQALIGIGAIVCSIVVARRSGARAALPIWIVLAIQLIFFAITSLYALVAGLSF